MVVWKVCSVSGQSDVEFKRFQNQFPQPGVVAVEAGCRTAVCFRPCVADQPWLYEQIPAQAIACSQHVTWNRGLQSADEGRS